METKQLTEEQIKLLKSSLPAQAVKPHPTKPYLSSIKAIYVVERLNDVFGIGKWHLGSEIIDNKSAMIVLRCRLIVPEYGIDLESFGGNDNGGEGSKNFDLGDAYKGATTDALTKICSYLEIGMDVYKGLVKSDAPAVNGTIKLPWLNPGTKEYTAAVKKLKAGTTTIAKIKSVMQMTSTTETNLARDWKSEVNNN